MLRVRIARFPDLVRGSRKPVKSALVRDVLPAPAVGFSRRSVAQDRKRIVAVRVGYCLSSE